jgi:hypothetical protein
VELAAPDLSPSRRLFTPGFVAVRSAWAVLLALDVATWTLAALRALQPG